MFCLGIGSTSEQKNDLEAEHLIGESWLVQSARLFFDSLPLMRRSVLFASIEDHRITVQIHYAHFDTKSPQSPFNCATQA